MKEQRKKIFRKFNDIQLDGVGVVEIILILVILIGLVLIFKDQITAIVEKAFEAIAKDTNSIIG
ncbi:MAG TPA: hypothetical protein DDY59_11305 [Lachnospiraceae bacterium]|jgi:hypothetical protein|nr:hypothetical protein [Lachnospiraceae bacterium]HCA70323.1 hypothetical protein [Lachnospiraceae bacterium]HCM12335.1 hypothetical protein [Lachnospiraceae bacterium]HCR40921.1 hypothetical protein [Lachnospiraceae bacterium]